MLKLKRSNPNGFVYISPQHIVSIELVEGMSVVWCTGRSSPYFIKDLPDEIMAMDEMVKFTNPLIAINPTPLSDWPR